MDKAKISSNVDEYIGNSPSDLQIILREIRKIIFQVVPDAEEIISYGMPSYKYKGKYLVHFAAFKNHIGFFPTASHVEDKIKEAGEYRTGKGTLQFPLDQVIPYSLIKKIVQVRLEEVAK